MSDQGLQVSKEMGQFLQALYTASAAMAELSAKWENLNVGDDAIVQRLSGWHEAFAIGLDDVPFTMWGIVEELENVLGVANWDLA
jgi:hypothetical protein